MISKPIFKQSIKNNWKLWLIITLVATLILSGFILSYDPVEYAALASAAQGTAFAALFSSATSLLGSLENFYKLIAVILGIVYTVFTANNLVVNEVDSGSMAYTLSTPIKRSSVIFTKSLYLVVSTILMYTIISIVGLIVVQGQYNNVSGYPITEDIKAAAETLNHKDSYVSNRLYLILENENALNEAAFERNMDTQSYTLYLEDKMMNRSFEETAEIIDEELTAEALKENPLLISQNNEALKVGSKILGLSVIDYHEYLKKPLVTLPQEPSEHVLKSIIDTSAKALEMTSEQISKNLSFLKNPKALEASTKISGLSEEQIITIANQAMIQSAKLVDQALEFDLESYIYLSLGLTALILAMSAISFFASTLFNRANLSLAIGGGIPFAFFLITMVQQLMDGSEILQYLTLTTLFNTDEILLKGEFKLGLLALIGVVIVFYTLSNIIFTKKDLPL